MFKYINILLSNDAVSFCYYKNSNDSKLISLKNLKKVIAFATKNNLKINFIYNNQQLPDEYEKIIQTTDHSKIIPIENFSPESLMIINYKNDKQIESLKDGENNYILRLEKKYINNLNDIIKSLIGKFKRLNLILLDIDKYNDNDLSDYNKQLKLLYNIIKPEYKNGNLFELNFVTDRILLSKMKNCNAGIDHITYAPDGRFYICPGFYYDETEDDFVIEKEGNIEIKNQYLFDIKNAPLCSKCDAFHCIRCVYLNQRSTLEVNTPSKQQCLISHYEREISKNLLNSLCNYEPFNKMSEIPNISYTDPIEIFLQPKKNPNERIIQKSNVKDNKDSNEKIIDLLNQLLINQKTIIELLSKK